MFAHNRYAYTNDNPINHTDPSGHVSIDSAYESAQRGATCGINSGRIECRGGSNPRAGGGGSDQTPVRSGTIRRVFGGIYVSSGDDSAPFFVGHMPGVSTDVLEGWGRNCFGANQGYCSVWQDQLDYQQGRGTLCQGSYAGQACAGRGADAPVSSSNPAQGCPDVACTGQSTPGLVCRGPSCPTLGDFARIIAGLANVISIVGYGTCLAGNPIGCAVAPIAGAISSGLTLADAAPEGCSTAANCVTIISTMATFVLPAVIGRGATPATRAAIDLGFTVDQTIIDLFLASQAG